MIFSYLDLCQLNSNAGRLFIITIEIFYGFSCLNLTFDFNQYFNYILKIRAVNFHFDGLQSNSF